MSAKKYPFNLRPLKEEEGGGWLIEYPDLPGCMSDGESQDEAIANGAQAVTEWIAAAEEWNKPIPAPGSSLHSLHYSGKYQQRLPKTLHQQLAERAKIEGVSLNQLAATFIAQGLGSTPAEHPFS